MLNDVDVQRIPEMPDVNLRGTALNSFTTTTTQNCFLTFTTSKSAGQKISPITDACKNIVKMWKVRISPFLKRQYRPGKDFKRSPFLYRLVKPEHNISITTLLRQRPLSISPERIEQKHLRFSKTNLQATRDFPRKPESRGRNLVFCLSLIRLSSDWICVIQLREFTTVKRKSLRTAGGARLNRPKMWTGRFCKPRSGIGIIARKEITIAAKSVSNKGQQIFAPWFACSPKFVAREENQVE